MRLACRWPHCGQYGEEKNDQKNTDCRRRAKHRHFVGVPDEARGLQRLHRQDGQEALDKVRSEAPDLVLLDVMMPRKNGYEVCQEIRAEPALQATRILMLTAKGRETEVTKGLAMGADAYMTKPFSTGAGAKVKLLLDIPA
jgi:DNA-binding response OmpR family regulator